MAKSKSTKSKPKAAKKVAAKKPVVSGVFELTSNGFKKVTLREARALKKAGKFASVREALKA